MVDGSLQMVWDGGDGRKGRMGHPMAARDDAVAARGGKRQGRTRRKRGSIRSGASTAIYALLASGMPAAVAQKCISLAGSTQCPAFSTASISTDSTLVGYYPFLSTVSDTPSFDSGLAAYVANGYASLKYSTLIGCSDFSSGNTTGFYARYTTSVICNGIVQNSITPCGLSGAATHPLCAESCAAYAESEQEITASNVCGNSNSGALTQIRADFTNCALPTDSLTGSCINAVDNQPNNCGFTSNVGSLCSYCSASSPNNTDSCCVFSDATTRCKGVTLPVVASSKLKPITMTATSSPSATSTSTSAAAAAHKGLTGGQVAGIVVGSILGALALLGLVIAGCLLLKRRRDRSPATSVFNQPSTSRSQQPPMAFNDGSRDQERAGMAVLPGGRVARMSALEGTDNEERAGTKYLAGGALRQSPSDEDEDSPAYGAASSGPPKRSGSLSSGSQLGMMAARAPAPGQDSSPSSNEDYTSPESHGQSEQLGFFKDYYSQDEIHTGDLVSTLWAYEPRAADEFHLERGDMIKVLGIWDDGWATGVRVRQRAEDWRDDSKVQRDSGMSNGSSRPPDTADEGEVKAFPLVCVCLPQHWRKTIEGESTEASDPTSRYPDLP